MSAQRLYWFATVILILTFALGLVAFALTISRTEQAIVETRQSLRVLTCTLLIRPEARTPENVAACGEHGR